MREAAASPPALIVVIGRRRVGKSFLLARTFTAPRTVSFQGDEQSERRHLDLLAGEAGRTLLGTHALSFASWEDALRFFGEQARREPLTLILDEVQWLKAAQGALDSIIQRHWDEWERAGVPLTLVLSGRALTLISRSSRPLQAAPTLHNEIAQQAHVPTGNLLRKLERLEDLGYILPRHPPGRRRSGGPLELPDR